MKRKTSPALKWGCLTPLAVAVALVCGIFVLDRFVPSFARRALPASATDVQEYYREYGNGDLTRLLRAKLPASDFPRYAERLKLRTHYDAKRNADIASSINSLRGFAGQSWFTPPRADATTYLDHKSGDDFFRVLWYSDGYVYFAAISS